ncbi:MAG: Glycosyltransferase [Phormidesmis priestleyi Ana]|uniref:Glycosyltransferase n=1 Tax=Phormidesmis priestleyi Ana TaxID=1666911 RepID=A0A0P7YZW3_9CYAN|nr:MAG: Glycosyltransferase [Phormidesmis priestleyi Ana]
MRKLLFLLPGTTKQFFAGGLTAELKTLRLAQQVCEAAVVTYRQREKDTLFLDDVLKEPLGASGQHYIFVVSWGFDVPRLIRRIGDRPIIYHAHSAGYGFTLPARIPIITVSRNTMGYWGEKALSSLIYHLPNEISPAFENRQLPRDIDVLVQARKSSEYLLRQLVPALQKCCNVVVLDRYVDDLIGLFNRSKIYLYDSAEYWGRYGLTEGFGLPPMEAMACGCDVFSSVNHALSDYLDPGFNCHKIAGYATDYDVQRIVEAANNWSHKPPISPQFFEPYRPAQLEKRLHVILQDVNLFFDYMFGSSSDHLSDHSSGRAIRAKSDIPRLTYRRVAYLSAKRVFNKVATKLKGQ